MLQILRFDYLITSQSKATSSDELVQYLEVKQQILLAYCVNVVFYMTLRAEGKSVRSHPVMRQLLELRHAIEKLRPIDSKLKHQIDRLLRQVQRADDGEPAEEMSTSAARPNLSAFLEGEDSDKDDAERAQKSTKEGVYRPPRIAAAPFKDDERESEKRGAKLERTRKRVRNSEMFEALRQEFGSAPEEASNTGLTAVNVEQRVLQEEEDERREFEEDRFVRLVHLPPVIRLCAKYSDSN